MLNIAPAGAASDLDGKTPGGVYLCQVGPAISCGACCGLYNIQHLSRENLTHLLKGRTQRFARVPRTIEAIDRFGEETLGAEGRHRPMKNFHHCPFLGLIGPQQTTVGCLLHPRADGNKGIDWRGLSYYGAYACATYFCPTCRELAPRYKRMVRQAVDNWYDYGLMITETGMLKTFFEQVEKRLERTVDATDLEGRPAAMAVVQRFLAIKHTWPFADPETFRPANFFFNQKEYAPPAIDFKAPGAETSRWAPVLTALWSNLADWQALCAAESFLDRMAGDLSAALAAPPLPPR
ncbi:conserved hypothetical cytosolic protein [Desulfosudis oleivorans Hxd3]|uniref:Conserved hypothetical cytosolic protein n=1 Tax=Desulfosudis oleivorans (strain DSM 6200 / JCM 39069 / Hxd3) TaxID=96561 RepID=A8ZT52_DESOH|nr:conserved hypothetical cytosolic protein [Desulfosudis oleivorans Hxd3]